MSGPARQVQSNRPTPHVPCLSITPRRLIWRGWNQWHFDRSRSTQPCRRREWQIATSTAWEQRKTCPAHADEARRRRRGMPTDRAVANDPLVLGEDSVLVAGLLNPYSGSSTEAQREQPPSFPRRWRDARMCLPDDRANCEPEREAVACLFTNSLATADWTVPSWWRSNRNSGFGPTESRSSAT
jgi:hypothetical protein